MQAMGWKSYDLATLGFFDKNTMSSLVLQYKENIIPNPHDGTGGGHDLMFPMMALWREELKDITAINRKAGKSPDDNNTFSIEKKENREKISKFLDKIKVYLDEYN